MYILKFLKKFCYGIAFDGAYLSSFGKDFDKSVIIYGADNS